MMTSDIRSWRVKWAAPAILSALFFVDPAQAAKISFDWIKPTPADRELTTVEWYPSAPAVFLNRKTLLVFGFTGHKGNQTHLDEYRRLKILNSEGLEEATISLPSVDFARVKELDARIVQPDGSVRKLSKEDIFEKKRQDVVRYKVISFALPQAEVGSIIEYRYRVVYENIIAPWQLYFQGWLPVLDSFIAVDVHEYTHYAINVFNPLSQMPEISRERRSARGVNVLRASYRFHDLPLVPDEPFSPPFEELAARVELMPHKIRVRDGWRTLAENLSWQALAKELDDYREKFREWSPKTEELVAELVAGLGGAEDRARAVYAFVHNEMELGASPCESFCPPDKLIKARQADRIDKNYLLQHMLTLAGVEASLVWLSPRTDARMDPGFPDYSKVRHLLVSADLDGTRWFLDPNARHLGFGSLEPHVEGARGLLVDIGPQWANIPQSDADRSTRRAVLDLEVDETGGIAGTGRLELTGHHAWLHIMWHQDHPVVNVWRRWLEPEAGNLHDRLRSQFPDLEVSEPTPLEHDAEKNIWVTTWTLASPEGLETDFVTLSTAAPLAMTRQPFTLDAPDRVTPVRLPFTFVDEVEMRLRWPEGWTLDGPASEPPLHTGAGDLETTAETSGNEYVYTRTFRLRDTDTRTMVDYKRLRDLFVDWTRRDLQQVTVSLD